MDHLWAPWRIEYVAGEKGEGCILCQKLEEEADEDNYILCRGQYNFVILNTFPYNSGHLMVVPYQHTGHFTELSPAVVGEMMQIVQICIQALREGLKVDGVNLGVNIGQAAGAGIDDHIHLHIVPRWLGDTNFMTAVGQTRVVPQELAESAHQLRPLILRAAEQYQRNVSPPEDREKGC